MYNYIIVDDEPLTRLGTEKKISKLNMPIQCIAKCGNGLEALEVLKNEHTDFIITDMDMPLMDGVTFIDSVRTISPNIPIIVISGYKNFEYLQKAIQADAVDYILKPFSKAAIKNSIDKSLELLNSYNDLIQNKNELLMNYIFGQITNYGQQELDKIIINAESPIFLGIYRGNNSKKLPTEWYYQLNDDSTLILIQKKYLNNIISFSNDETLFIYNEEINKKNINDCLNGLIEVIDSYPFNCYGIINKTNSLESSYHIDNETILKISFLIESGNITEVSKNITLLFNLLADTHTLICLKETGLKIIENIKNIIDIHYNSKTNYTYPKVMADIHYQTSFNETISYFTSFIINVTKSLSVDKIYDSQDIISNIIKYINIHYREPLNQEFVASLFYINSSYLSTLFKEKIGMKYTDYINQLRIEKAKQLLAQTNKKINTISKYIGFENEKYFFRVFKKYTNYTPEEFRKLTKKSNDCTSLKEKID